uniref:Aminoacyl-tRNA hydrolase n=1 Tax=Panagrolaimus sp. ES5 TaxID=591445 RepID=A0AC34FH89_9BILA
MSTKSDDTLVMYLVLRKDLTSLPGWNTGALVTQAAHASTACIWKYKDDPNVQSYLDPANIDHMHKVTLSATNSDELQKAMQILKENNIDHRIWREDDMDVCIAVKPMLRSHIKPILSGFKLFK